MSEPSLRDRLRAEQAPIRLSALDQLLRTPDASYRGELVRICMDDRSAPHRLAAARALRFWWPDPQVIRAYAARVTDELPVAAEIVAILAGLDDPRALDILERAFFSGRDVWVKLKVLGVMDRASEKRLREFLMKSRALDDSDERIRAAAVALLGRVPNPTAMHAVIAKLKDPCARVRANALEAIGARYAGVEVARVMASMVADRHHRVRSTAIKFLLLYGVRSAEEHLRAMVESTEIFVRAAAAWVLREVRPTRRMAEWIAHLANDACEPVAKMAQAASLALKARPA